MKNVIAFYIQTNPFDIYAFRFVTADGELKIYEHMHNSAGEGELMLRVWLPRTIDQDYIKETLIDDLAYAYKKAGWQIGTHDGYDDYSDYSLLLSHL